MSGLDVISSIAPAYVPVFFRLTGLTLSAPLLGHAQIPRTVKVLVAAVLALALAPSAPAVAMPTAVGQLALGLGVEIAIGMAMGMVLSMAFLAAQWAGSTIGQQMGLELAEVFDPEQGGRGSMLGEMYLLFTLVVFLSMGGHRAMIRGIAVGFHTLPPFAAVVHKPPVDLLVGLLQAATTLAIRLAAPVLLTLLVVDLAMGFVGRTMPQLSVLSAGLSMRAVVGWIVLILGLALCSSVIRQAVVDSLRTASAGWAGLSR